MKLITTLFIALIAYIYPFCTLADPNNESINELSKDMKDLKESSMSPEEKAAAAGKIFDKLENNTEGEDKILTMTLKEETNKYISMGLNYNKFLNKVADPSFFNLKNAQDPANLDQQINTAKEYLKNSTEIRDYTKNLPETIRAALKAKNISELKIESTLKGIKDSEAQAAKTPAMIFEKRTEHAAVLLKGLEFLKAKPGKWRYDEKINGIRIKEKSDLDLWNNEILTPMNKIEKDLV